MANKTLKADPFEAIPKVTPKTSATYTKPKTYKHFTVHLSLDLQDRMKNAVYWTPGLTLAGLCETAIDKELSKIEKENGGRFAKREADLRGGRPVK